jgi:hypothetical protein
VTCDLCQFQELRWFEEEGEESLRSHAPLSAEQAHPRAEFAEAVVSTLFYKFNFTILRVRDFFSNSHKN